MQKEETEYEGLEKAGFSIYNIKDLSIVKQQKVRRVSKERYELLDEEAKKDETIVSKEQEDGTYKLMDIIDYYYKITYKEGEEQSLQTNGEVNYPYNLENEEKLIFT